MREALIEAQKAYAIDEVPIGAVIVREDTIIARAFNRRNTDKNTLAHAEMIAINEASNIVGDWRLDDCTMYITLEPCPMCAGAIINARIQRVVFGALDPKAGAAGTVVNILENPCLNHRVEVISGLMEAECKDILQQFFRHRR